MTDRPILFSAPMVRAILAGTKTQTRRVVKPTRGRPIEFLGGGPRGGADWNNPECWGYEWADGPAFVTLKVDPTDRETQQYPCPYGQPGDRLWVRESWRAVWSSDDEPPRAFDAAYRFWYEADAPLQDGYGKLRPSIHMPRCASRITLEITGVRVERLQAISEADALAEGVASLPLETSRATPKADFQALWESINGADSWTANPWVWVVEFKRIQAPGATPGGAEA